MNRKNRKNSELSSAPISPDVLMPASVSATVSEAQSVPAGCSDVAPSQNIFANPRINAAMFLKSGKTLSAIQTSKKIGSMVEVVPHAASAPVPAAPVAMAAKTTTLDVPCVADPIPLGH